MNCILPTTGSENITYYHDYMSASMNSSFGPLENSECQFQVLPHQPSKQLQISFTIVKIKEKEQLPIQLYNWNYS